MNVVNIVNNSRGNDIARQSLAHSIAIGLLLAQGIRSVKAATDQDLSKSIMLMAVGVQDAVAAALVEDNTVNADQSRKELLDLECATIRAIFREEATDAWVRDAKAYAANMPLVKGADGEKLGSLESWKAKASASLDRYIGAIKAGWNAGILIAVDTDTAGNVLPEALEAFKKRTKAENAKKVDFASHVSGAVKACDVFAAHIRSLLIGQGVEANELLCLALADLMPALQIAVTDAQQGKDKAMDVLVSITDAINTATLRDVVASTVGAGSGEANTAALVAATLPEGDNEETLTEQSVAA